MTATATLWLAGSLLLAVSAGAQSPGTAGLKRAEELSPRSSQAVAERKKQRESAPRAAAAKRKPGAPRRSRPKPPATAPVVPGDLPSRSLAELQALIAEQRTVVKTFPRDNTARRNLGWISIEAADRVLQAQSLGRTRDESVYVMLIRDSLADTLWRVTRLARNETGRGLAALGLYFTDGILVPPDAARGCDYFAKAAEAGHVEAAWRASRCLAKSDPQAARRWLETSAAGGNAAAQEALGRACIEGTVIDSACAKKWLDAAAAKGRVSAISVLAWLHASEGTAESLSRASKLYRAAAQAGDVAAQNNLGELIETGRGTAPEPAQALTWYRKSAESGFAPAQFNLARLLAFGIGTERDLAAAKAWAAKARDQGIAQATELLKLIAEGQGRR